MDNVKIALNYISRVYMYGFQFKRYKFEGIFKYLKVGTEYVMIAYTHMFKYIDNVTKSKVQRTKLLYISKG